MALEFAYRRHAEYHCPVFWVHADNYEKFMQGYRKIAAAAQLSSEFQDEDLLMAVQRWLQSQPNWLLMLDNADDLRIFGLKPGLKGGTHELNKLLSFVPCRSHGTILWTTRDESAVGYLVGVKRGINVTSMTTPEAETLLKSLGGNDTTADNAPTVADILERLDRLPLAITQAAFYMRQTSISFEQYLRMLQKEKKRWRVLKESAPGRHRQGDVPNSVMHTWRITVDHLRHENSLAHWILYVAAYFNNQNIPLTVIQAAGKFRMERAKSESRSNKDEDQDHDTNKSDNSDDDGDDDDDDGSILKAATRLKQFSFLQIRTGKEESRSYDMHKLVQEATRYAISRDAESDNATRIPQIALDVTLQRFPSGEYGTWDRCERLLSHALTVSEWPGLVAEKIKIPKLLSRVSLYLYQQGRSGEAEEIYVKVLRR